LEPVRRYAQRWAGVQLLSAAYAKEFSAIAEISYSHWKNAVAAGVKKADRPALLPLI